MIPFCGDKARGNVKTPVNDFNLTLSISDVTNRLSADSAEHGNILSVLRLVINRIANAAAPFREFATRWNLRSSCPQHLQKFLGPRCQSEWKSSDSVNDGNNISTYLAYIAAVFLSYRSVHALPQCPTAPQCPGLLWMSCVEVVKYRLCQN